MKASKDEANYRRGTPEKHCANCKHYRVLSYFGDRCPNFRKWCPNLARVFCATFSLLAGSFMIAKAADKIENTVLHWGCILDEAEFCYVRPFERIVILYTTQDSYTQMRRTACCSEICLADASIPSQNETATDGGGWRHCNSRRQIGSLVQSLACKIIVGLRPCEIGQSQHGPHRYFVGGGKTAISQDKIYIDVNASIPDDFNWTGKFGFLRNYPRALLIPHLGQLTFHNSQLFVESAIRDQQNRRSRNSGEDESRSPNYKPFSESNNWIALPKPPPWSWLALLGAAAFFSFVGVVMSPDSQPAPRMRNAVSAALYIFGLVLGLSAIPVALWFG